MPTRHSFRSKNTHKMKVNGWKKIFHANGNERKQGLHIYVRQNTL